MHMHKSNKQIYSPNDETLIPSPKTALGKLDPRLATRILWKQIYQEFIFAAHCKCKNHILLNAFSQVKQNIV